MEGKRWKSSYKNQSEQKTTFDNKLEPKQDIERPKTVNGDPITRRPGDGAQSWTDNQRDSESHMINSLNRSKTTTLFAKDGLQNKKTNENSASHLPEHAYDRMWRYHHGWDNDDSGRREYNDKIAVTQALADELPITIWEKQCALNIVLQTNGRSFNRCGGLEALVLGAFAYIRDKEISESQFNSENYEDMMNNRIVGSKKYKRVCENHNVDYYKAYKQVKKLKRENR